MASVSFRLFNAGFCRIAVVGLACVALAKTALAGEGGRDIEIVPFHNSADTNASQVPQKESQNFEIWQPSAPKSLANQSPGPRPQPLPHPQQQTLSKEEQQLLDRRRNWVFMRPEDYATTDSKTGKSLLGTDKNDDDNLTAMERYYHRMEQSGKSTDTNDFSRLNLDRSSSMTNSIGGALPKSRDAGAFGPVPFSATPEAGVFQPMTVNDSAKIFDNPNTVTVLTPEEVRMQADQKTHMDNFKQLWDIDQASSAATPVVAPSSSPVDSAPLFGASMPGMSSGFKSLGSSPSGNSSGDSSTSSSHAPADQPRHSTPPHSDFMPVQRAF